MRTSATPLVIEAAICPYRSAVPVWDVHGMATEGRACLAAGATIVHHHHDMRFDAAAAIEEMLAMGRAIKASHPEAILYPDFLAGAGVDEWTGHIAPLAHAGLLDLVPVDPGGAFSGQLNDDGVPVGANKTRFSFDDANATLALAHALGRPLAVGVSEPFNMRWALAQHRLGRLPAGSIIKLYFGGEYSLVKLGKRALNFGLPPTRASLDAYLGMLEGSGLAWSVGLLGDALLDSPLARYAVERGGHLRVGIEDAAGRTTLSNVETVEAAVALAQSVGRPIAGAAEARAVLGYAGTSRQAAG